MYHYFSLVFDAFSWHMAYRKRLSFGSRRLLPAVWRFSSNSSIRSDFLKIWLQLRVVTGSKYDTAVPSIIRDRGDLSIWISYLFRVRLKTCSCRCLLNFLLRDPRLQKPATQVGQHCYERYHKHLTWLVSYFKVFKKVCLFENRTIFLCDYFEYVYVS